MSEEIASHILTISVLVFDSRTSLFYVINILCCVYVNLLELNANIKTLKYLLGLSSQSSLMQLSSNKLHEGCLPIFVAAVGLY